MVIASTIRIYDIVHSYVGKVGAVKHAMCLQILGEDVSFGPLVDFYKQELSSRRLNKVAPMTTLSPDTVAMLIYTSGELHLNH